MSLKLTSRINLGRRGARAELSTLDAAQKLPLPNNMERATPGQRNHLTNPGQKGPIAPTGTIQQSPGQKGPISPTGTIQQSPGQKGPIAPTGTIQQSPVQKGPIAPTGTIQQSPGQNGPTAPTPTI